MFFKEKVGENMTRRQHTRLARKKKKGSTGVRGGEYGYIFALGKEMQWNNYESRQLSQLL